MGIQVALKHRTIYRYDKAVSLGPQIIRLRPGLHCRTPILSYSLDVTPSEHTSELATRSFLESAGARTFPEEDERVCGRSESRCGSIPPQPFRFPARSRSRGISISICALTLQGISILICWSILPDLCFATFVESCRDQRTGTVNFLLLLNRKVRDEIGYVTRLEHGIQTSEETLQKRSGSCRDSAWLLVECLRNLGIAARFVSGYLIQLAEAKTELNGPNGGPQSDSADLHAWAEAFLPGAGWIGLDPTSGLLAGEGHIPLACTSSASQAAPISGTAERASTDFSYEMSVRRLNDSRPLSQGDAEEQWLRIRQVAHRVDAELEAHDVRLTMGGEPTYVGIDEPESAAMEYRRPRRRSSEPAAWLSFRLFAKKWRQAALLHYGQGKWYPGEQLPRWALSCFWRADGVPVWEDVELIAARDHDYGFKTGRRFKVYAGSHAATSGHCRKHSACF